LGALPDLQCPAAIDRPIGRGKIALRSRQARDVTRFYFYFVGRALFNADKGNQSSPNGKPRAALLALREGGFDSGASDG